MMGRYYDQEGNPMSFEDWSRAFENSSARQVALTNFKEGGCISTVWLGLNHNFGGVGPPLIFETMAFVRGVDERQERYATKAEALAGHQRMVELVMGELAEKGEPGAFLGGDS